jgi:hypothetical protein
VRFCGSAPTLGREHPEDDLHLARDHQPFAETETADDIRSWIELIPD